MANKTNEVKGLLVDYINETINVTKKFLEKAGKFGTAEQKAMVEVKREFPDFKIVVVESSSKKESYGNLTVERMIAYVELKDSDNTDSFKRDVKVYVDENTSKLIKGKYATIKRLFLAKYKDKYNELSLEEVTRLDEKEKEFKVLADGLIGKIVSVKTSEDKKDNVVPMHTEMNKAVNE